MFETPMLRALLISVSFGAPALAQSDSLLEAVRVHREGVADQARVELDACVAEKCGDRERLTLLTGVLELSEGNAALATERLTGSKPPKGLEAFHGWYLGEAQAWAGQRAVAVKTLTRARKAAPTWLQPRIDRRLAELFLDLGDTTKTRALLDADPDVSKLPELLYTRALARQSAKLTALALADWKLLALKFPSHPHGIAALTRLQTDAAWAPTFDESLSRAQALLNSGDSKGCLSSLEELSSGKRSDANSARLALLKGQALLARGKERDADAQAQLAIAASGPPSVAAQALLTSAKRLMRLQDNAGARAAFKKLDDTFPNDSNADEAGYLAAWLAMNGGDFDTAVADFIAFETRHADSRKRDEARWFQGFSLVRAKKYAQAREVLQTVAADFPRSALAPQALYWATRAAQLSTSTGAPDAGKAIDLAAEYTALARNFAGTFYALLATERLNELGVEAPAPFATEPKSLVVKRPAGLELAALLARTGLFRDAAAEVSRALGSVPPADAITWGHALQSLGDFGAAHTLAARYLWGAVYTLHTPEALALMYPRAYRASVETWAEKNGLEPALAWAIMRRESAFVPDVTSQADARGLMQIIPPTARSIAQSLKVPAADDAELYAPDWNIRLGTWYLHALSQRLKHPTLVAAAYNGGPSAVARWAKERGEEPLDQWVEEIPFKETRGYVKQVTTDLFIYRQLYGGAQQRLSLVVPQPGTGVDY